MSDILSWIGDLIADVVDWFSSFFTSTIQWLYNALIYFVALLIHDLLVIVQTIILAIITLANGAIALLPACNVPAIDLSPFSQTYNSAGHTFTSAICWLMPISFLTTATLCMIQAVMAYLMISWILRWLKVIK